MLQWTCRLILSLIWGSFCLSAAAEERLEFYNNIREAEKKTIQAMQLRSARDLLKIHNEIMGAVLNDDERLKQGKIFVQAPCFTAYINLSISVLFYAAVLDPTISDSSGTEAETLDRGDQAWAEFVRIIAVCEEAIGISILPLRPARLSNMIRSAVP